MRTSGSSRARRACKRHSWKGGYTASVQRSLIEPATRTAVRVAIVAAAVSLAVVPPAAIAVDDAASGRHDIAARAALEALSTADRASQVIMTSVPGTTLDRSTARRLRMLRPGGLILFARNYRSRDQLRRFDLTLQVAARAGDRARPMALVSVDQEGGVVKRLRDAPPTRSHPQLGRVDRVRFTRAQARDTARVLRSVGINMDLAPVADLDLGPRHVMGARSFGRAPVRVARHVVAFALGLRDGGVAASVKHFPGFGGATVNSDDALARVVRPRAQLRSDLVPFRAAVARDVESIMVSHGIYPALDRRRPASTSPAAYRLLRRGLGYDGVAITDSLHAAGFVAATGRGVAEGCVATIAAGADIALLTGTLVDAIRCRARILAAVESGALPQARLDEAALRVLLLKSRLGLLPPTAEAASTVSPQAPAG